MPDYEELIGMLRRLTTEQVNESTIDIDRLTPLEIVSRINDEDGKVAGVVRSQLPRISQAAEIFAHTLQNGGRVFYIGAGTSGRLGVLDAAECPPTFGTDPGQIIGLISGGYETLVLSAEGVEDRKDQAVEDLRKHDLSAKDFVIGLAASRRTPYTVEGLRYAASTGCRTAFVICNRWEQPTDTPLKVDIVIELEVGAEAITGSTRMKSATAQKMTLNMISTAAMVLLGKTYGNLMVDLQARSDKLAARSRRILIDLFNITVEKADELLRCSEGSVKVALVMHKYNCDVAEARSKIQAADGFVSKIK